MPLPDFLIPGFPRCGTSFLVHNLPKHSMIHIPAQEVNYYGNPNKSLDYYNGLFEEGKVNGEKTPGYILRKEAMHEIELQSPEAKLIICVRHPLQALHSFYSHRIREFNKGLSPGFDPRQYPFHDIVLKDLSINLVSLDTYNFNHHISLNIPRSIDKRQIMFVVNEEMRADTRGVLATLFSFLGLNNENIDLNCSRFFDEEMRYQEIDYSADEYRQALSRLIDYYKPTIEAFYEYLGREIPSWRKIDILYNKTLNQ